MGGVPCCMTVSPAMCVTGNMASNMSQQKKAWCVGASGRWGPPCPPTAPAPWLGGVEDPGDLLALDSRPPALHGLRIYEDRIIRDRLHSQKTKQMGTVPTRTRQPVLIPFLPFSRETLSI